MRGKLFAFTVLVLCALVAMPVVADAQVPAGQEGPRDKGGQTQPAPAPQPQRSALVVDGGDKDSWVGDLADNMAEDADGMAALLRGLGYTINRFSQYWGNGFARLTKNLLRGVISSYARTLRAGDSLFIFIGAHGNARGFVLYNSSGNGQSDYVTYAELDSWLDQLPAGVNITIMLDACNCGGAIASLQGPNRTIMTATDGNTEAAGGQGLTDSFTEDFLEAFQDVQKADTNRDGVVSWREAFDYARSQGESYNPQFWSPDAGNRTNSQPNPQPPAPTEVDRIDREKHADQNEHGRNY